MLGIIIYMLYIYISIKTNKDMKALFNNAKFETKTGLVEIGQLENGLWFYEFKSGYSNGLHNPEPFKSFDQAYLAMKKASKTEIKNQSFE